MNRINTHLNIIWLLIGILLASCSPQSSSEILQIEVTSETETQPAEPALTHSLPTPVVRTLTKTATMTSLPARTLTYTPAPTETQTPDPYDGLSVPSLVRRSYGGGEVQSVEVMAVNSYFTRTLFAYPSDGLMIYGFMNEPKRGEPPFPVVIALHGYIDPEIYDTVDYTTRYADALGREGFLILHPNLRGYPPSDEGDNLFRVGMAVDVLNLMAIIKDQAGQPGPLFHADPQAIGLWGHSMGGGVSTRVMTVSPEVDAVVLYGAMSGDELNNFERILNYFSNGQRGQEELSYPPEAFDVISSINYLERVSAAISIHHGEDDGEVPLAWSLDLCRKLQELDKQVECYTYEGQPHTFNGEGDQLFMQRMVEFFTRELKKP